MPVDVEEIIQIDTSSDFDGNGQNPTPLSLSSTGVAPGTYTNATVTVDSKGRVTAISSGSASYNPEIPVIGSATYEIDADKIIDKIIIKPTATGNCKIGTTSGGNEIFDEDMTNGVDVPFFRPQYYSSSTTIYFTGNFIAKLIIQ